MLKAGENFVISSVVAPSREFCVKSRKPHEVKCAGEAVIVEHQCRVGKRSIARLQLKLQFPYLGLLLQI